MEITLIDITSNCLLSSSQEPSKCLLYDVSIKRSPIMFFLERAGSGYARRSFLFYFYLIELAPERSLSLRKMLEGINICPSLTLDSQGST